LKSTLNYLDEHNDTQGLIRCHRVIALELKSFCSQYFLAIWAEFLQKNSQQKANRFRTQIVSILEESANINIYLGNNQKLVNLSEKICKHSVQFPELIQNITNENHLHIISIVHGQLL
jgi:hypothetical protein